MLYGTQEADLLPGTNPLMVDALFWSETDNGELKCELCPRYCIIPEGKTGFCGTRFNYFGKLYAINYGLISSVHLDPYEKKPLYHFHPGKWVLSIGTFGCNMACGHCQNSEISQRQITRIRGQFEYHSPEDVLAMCKENVADGISFTYNEPTIWMEYAVACAKLIKIAGFNTSFVTNGYMTKATLNTIGPHLDAANVDVKGFNDRTYKLISKVTNPEEILTRVEEMVFKWNVHVEITTNVIPGYNDSDKTFKGIANWIVNKLGELTPWHISRYHPAYKMDAPATPIETLLRGREIGRNAGLKFVYLGNVADPEGDGTLCPSCGKTVVKRHLFSSGQINVSNGRCGFCGEGLGIKT